MPETLLNAAPVATYNVTAMMAGPGYLPDMILLRPAVSAALVGRRRTGPVTPEGVAPHHVWLAGTRLRMSLMAWAAREGDDSLTGCDAPAAIGMLMADAPTQARLTDALMKAAAALLLHDPDDVSARLDALALDFAAVEAMREGILAKTKALIRHLASSRTGRLGQAHMVRHCGLLLVPVLSRMQARLNAADDCANDVLGALRDRVGTQSVLRSCTGFGARQPEWTRILALWDAPSSDDDRPERLGQTHAFLMATSMGDTMSRD